MLHFDEIHVGYGRSIVLHGVSVSVPENGVAAALRHNGAGKSTLLRAATGLLKPRKGASRLGGEDVTALAPHQRVARGMAYVPHRVSSASRI
jgi:urea transport system ATP-binding protein